MSTSYVNLSLLSSLPKLPSRQVIALTIGGLLLLVLTAALSRDD
jgi:hypothetical protein